MTGYYWRGIWNGPYAEAAMQTTRDFIATNLASTPNSPLDLGNQTTTWAKTDSTAPDMITVPNVVGMSPDEAIEALKTIGLDGRVLKKGSATKDEKSNSSWPLGVVSQQSVTPGTRLIVGSKRIIELTVTSKAASQSDTDAADDSGNGQQGGAAGAGGAADS